MKLTAIAALALMLSGCSYNWDNATPVPTAPAIYPDYTFTTMPPNIAPPNFMMRGAQRIYARISHADIAIECHGTNTISIPPKQWRKLCQAAIGDTLTIAVSALTDGTARSYAPFSIAISPDSIDRYMSYRLIEPGYEVWNKLRIEERDLSTYATRPLADNRLCDAACINCHTNGSNGRSFFHLRGAKGGTILNDNGHLRKIDTRAPGRTASATYGELSQCGRYGIFSANNIIPALHTSGEQRLEVFDEQADLVLIDFDNNTLQEIPTKGQLVSFPTFAHADTAIIYCCADTARQPADTKQMRYSIACLPMHKDTVAYGNAAILWNGSQHGASASFPKVSPNGQWLLFTQSAYGTFPIWHRDADLAIIDLRTGQSLDLTAANDTCSDSYHSWSSNSRWFVFASKRDDGIYGKPYFCHIDSYGHVSKAFALPVEHPQSFDFTTLSYNIPELSPAPVAFDAIDIEHIYHNVPAEHCTIK